MTFPGSEPSSYFSPRLLMVLKAIVPEILLISGTAGLATASRIPDVKCYLVPHRPSGRPVGRVLRYCATQIRLAAHTIQLSRKVDAWVFHTGGDTLILAMAAARLLRKPVVLVLTGSSAGTLVASGDGYAGLLEVVSAMTSALATRIGVYTAGAAETTQLKKRAAKVRIVHEHYVDPVDFRECHDINEREPIVGYLGRLSQEKGILNLVDAATILCARQPEVRFVIGGTGPLERELRERLERASLQGRIDLLGFIEHDKVPDFLSGLKLLVLPSYAEGLPMVVIEGMACGVPVLATTAGSLPDLIRDEFTGFIARDNRPDSLAADIERALSNRQLLQIAIRAKGLVEARFTYAAAVEGYRQALTDATRG